MTEELLRTGIDRCRRADVAVTRLEASADPPAVARPGSASRASAPPSTPGDADGHDASIPTPEALLAAGTTVAIEPLHDADPTTVLSRLWNDRNNGRAALFVVPSRAVADAVERLLSPPVGAIGTDDGRRFHAGPDRIPLSEGGYAAVPTGAELVWRESWTVRDHARGIRPSDADDPDDGPSADDGPWLELRAGDSVLARLDGIDALDCPPRARFPYAYHRDGDKQIRVLDFAGRPVQRYTGVAAMRRDGFRPVPAPLVPEHMFDGSIEGWWAVLPATE